MKTIRRYLRLPHALAGFARDQRGVSAVEFAMLLPLMITLYLGIGRDFAGRRHRP